MITQKKGEWMELVVPTIWNGLTIQKLLQEVWQAPKGLLHQWRMDKGVKLQNEPVPWNIELQEGQKLQLHLFRQEEYGVLPEYLPVEPIFEDEHLLIVNKHFGMDTHPNQPGQGGTLANGVAFHWQINGLDTKVRHIHRLDRDTTGGVIFAKHALSGAILDRMLAAREIKRTYYAFVQGIPKQKKGTINEPIGRDRHHPTRRRVSDRGDQAITHFRVIDTFPKHDLSLLELQLETGRTHQIRVHVSHCGHPIVGDTLYGGQTRRFARQALHAGRIELVHPFTQEVISVDIPWPADLRELHASLT